jgi:hypothetical protein
MIGQPQRSANLMSDPARMDFAEHRLRTFIGQLDACETIEERDQALKAMIWEATDILVRSGSDQQAVHADEAACHGMAGRMSSRPVYRRPFSVQVQPRTG